MSVKPSLTNVSTSAPALRASSTVRSVDSLSSSTTCRPLSIRSRTTCSITSSSLNAGTMASARSAAPERRTCGFAVKPRAARSGASRTARADARLRDAHRGQRADRGAERARRLEPPAERQRRVRAERERLVGVERALEADELVQPLERVAGEPLGELLRRLHEAGLDPRHARARGGRRGARASPRRSGRGRCDGRPRRRRRSGRRRAARGDQLLDRGLLAGEQAVRGRAPAVLEAADLVERRAADGPVRAVEVAARPGLVGVAVREDREVAGPRGLRPSRCALRGPQAVDRAAGDHDRVVGESVAEVLEPARRGPGVVVEVDEHVVRRRLGAGVAGARQAGHRLADELHAVGQAERLARAVVDDDDLVARPPRAAPRRTGRSRRGDPGCRRSRSPAGRSCGAGSPRRARRRAIRLRARRAARSGPRPRRTRAGRRSRTRAEPRGSRAPARPARPRPRRSGHRLPSAAAR